MKMFDKHTHLLKNGFINREIQIRTALMITLILMMPPLMSCNSGTKSSPQDQPPAVVAPVMNTESDGATLLDYRCSTCHSASKPKQTRKTADQWDKTVSRMMSKGARLTETEKAVLLDYLGKTYGP